MHCGLFVTITSGSKSYVVPTPDTPTVSASPLYEDAAQLPPAFRSSFSDIAASGQFDRTWAQVQGDACGHRPFDPAAVVLLAHQPPACASQCCHPAPTVP